MLILMRTCNGADTAPRLLMETSLRTLETVVTLVGHSHHKRPKGLPNGQFSDILPIGQARSASLLLAMAVRMLYTLGGNRYCTIHQEEGGHLRALFWL
jgi:hypothetical protein